MLSKVYYDSLCLESIIIKFCAVESIIHYVTKFCKSFVYPNFLSVYYANFRADSENDLTFSLPSTVAEIYQITLIITNVMFRGRTICSFVPKIWAS